MEEKILIKGVFSRYNIITILSDMLAVFWVVFGIIMAGVDDDPFSIVAGFGFALLSLCIGHLVGFLLSNIWCPEITVTNKRVYGKDAFGKRVDLPIDMISSVATSIFNGIGIATSSGRITFWFCKNKNDVFNEISKLLLDRQDKSHTTVTKIDNTLDVSKELKKFKETLFIA